MTTLVGADIQDVEEVRQSLEIFGDRYVRRIYTDDEIDDCWGRANGVEEALASRFAAKEALFKILTSGNSWESWREVEVRCLKSGRPTITLRGTAAEQAGRQGIATISLSLSQSGGTASAVVVAEIDREK
jgi:holo-[acyl-carrier protein] synthase